MKDRQNARVALTMYVADDLTDYRLAVSILNFKFYPARQPQVQKAPKRLDVSKLKEDNKRQTLLIDIRNNLGALQLNSEDPQEDLTVFRNAFRSSAVDNLEHESRKHQDWFDENDEEIKIFLKKHTAYTKHIKMILAQYPTRQPATFL